MSTKSVVKGVFAAAAFAFVASVHAGEMKDQPASVDESAPSKAGKKAEGKAGKAAMPNKVPASVSESAPGKAGKERPAPLQNDSKNLPNPKTPAGVSESAPAKAK